MYISEIQKRLTELVSGPNRYPAFNLAVAHGANPAELTDGYHIALWFEGAPKKVKEKFIETFARDGQITICDYCGKFMIEGYLVYEDPYCSEECVIKSYQRDVHDADNPRETISREAAKAMFEHDRLRSENENFCHIFWTQWY